MRRASSRISILIALLSLASVAVGAQEIVHALAGTIEQINLPQKTVHVVLDDGSDGTFRESAVAHVSVDFDKNLRSGASTLEDFKQTSGHVIVYYYGEGNARTVVALKSLGLGPVKSVAGVVVKLDKHAHALTIQDQAGATETFALNQSTVADTDSGVAEGLKFDAHKGEKVRIAAMQVNGNPVALFINGALSF